MVVIMSEVVAKETMMAISMTMAMMMLSMRVEAMTKATLMTMVTAKLTMAMPSSIKRVSPLHFSIKQ